METINQQTAVGQPKQRNQQIKSTATSGLSIDEIKLQWAIYYQGLGISVFPVRGKTPLVKWGEFQNRLPTKEEIYGMWKQFPGSDIGMVTGPFTQRLVLDVDGEAGAASIKGLPIPTTPTVRTQRGVQYHFGWPSKYIGKTTLTAIFGEGSGVDLRGDGGYCKVPPSDCTDGTRYEFHEGKMIGQVQLADAPDWLIQAVELKNKGRTDRMEQPVTDGSQNWIEDLLGGVGVGDRHEAFTKLAGYYFNCMHSDVAAQHLRDWNSKCTPPMEDIEDKIADFKQRIQSGEYDSKYIAKKAAEPKDLKLVTASELIKEHKNRPEYLADRLIPMGSSTIFSGWQGLGKTFVATDLAIEVSKRNGSGKWLGEFEVKKGPCLWIDNEMGGGLTSYRLKQLLSAKGIKPDELNLYYHARNRMKLTSEKHYAQLRAELAQIKPVLVVIDSMASCHTLSENESSDMRHFFDDLVAPLCEEFKCVMMFVDHERKQQAGMNSTGGQRLRGSGAKGDSVDVIISLDKKEDMLILEHSKARYSKRLDPFVIDILDVPNGVVVKKREIA